jgi:hypothetical protein
MRTTAMTIGWKRQLRSLEGRQVDVALRDGTRIDCCELVCGARARVDRLWLVRDDEDLIVPLWEVTSVEASHATPPRAA